MDPTNYFETHNIDEMDQILNQVFDTLTDKIKIAHAKDVKRSGDDKTEKHADIGDDGRAGEPHLPRRRRDRAAGARPGLAELRPLSAAAGREASEHPGHHRASVGGRRAAGQEIPRRQVPRQRPLNGDDRLRRKRMLKLGIEDRRGCAARCIGARRRPRMRRTRKKTFYLLSHGGPSDAFWLDWNAGATKACEQLNVTCKISFSGGDMAVAEGGVQLGDRRQAGRHRHDVGAARSVDRGGQGRQGCRHSDRLLQHRRRRDRPAGLCRRRPQAGRRHLGEVIWSTTSW